MQNFLFITPLSKEILFTTLPFVELMPKMANQKE